MVATITLGIDPILEIGPLTLAWHGIMTAVGILVGGAVAVRYGRARGLNAESIVNVVLVMAVAGLIGSRVFYLLVNQPGDLLSPAEWFGTRGFAFYGGMIFGTIAVGVYIWRRRLSLRYLDALAFGFPLGSAVGRIGDLISGEHYGAVSTAPWAIRYTHPDAEVPSNAVAYHSGGLYEVLLGLALFALIWPLRDRFRRPGSLLWAVIGLYGVGRFAMFFFRSDSSELALGLVEAQWTSIALIAAAALGAWLSGRVTPTRQAARSRPSPASGSA